MGFFKPKQAPAPAGPPRVPPLSSGRSLRSSQSIDACLATIEALVDSYRVRKYTHLPAYDRTGFTWSGNGSAPDTTVNFDDSADDVLFLTLRSDDAGQTLMGLYPLGSGDERLNMLPVIGHWKQRDPSLSSTGILPAGQLTLTAPVVPAEFVAESLALASAPVTPRNVELMGTKLGELTMLKLMQFIGSQDERQAHRFADSHPYGGGAYEAHLQSLLTDAVALYPGLAPYVQGVPTRIRAVLLNGFEDRPDILPLER